MSTSCSRRSWSSPRPCADTISPRIRDGKVVLDDVCPAPEEDPERLDRIYIIACGSSYHVGMAAKYTLERLLRIPVEVTLASEFRYCDPIVDPTAPWSSSSASPARPWTPWPPCGRPSGWEPGCCPSSTWWAVLHCPGVGRRAVHLGRAGDRRGHHQGLLHPAGGHLPAGPAFRPDLLGTVAQEDYAAHGSRAAGSSPTRWRRSCPTREDIQYFASQYFNHDSVFFIGRNMDYAVGLEGSLKLKEISYIHSEAYAAGELKHGTISLIEDGTLVVALASYGDLFDKADEQRGGGKGPGGRRAGT